MHSKRIPNLQLTHRLHVIDEMLCYRLTLPPLRLATRGLVSAACLLPRASLANSLCSSCVTVLFTGTAAVGAAVVTTRGRHAHNIEQTPADEMKRSTAMTHRCRSAQWQLQS
jgi:hypothetical protein